MTELNARKLNAKVLQRINVSPNLVVLRVRPDSGTDGWELPEFTPGQFAVLGLPGSAGRVSYSDPEPVVGTEAPEPDKLIKRAYSIASSSVEKEYVEFYVALVTSGALTPRLFNLSPGDSLWMSKKFTGIFTMSQVPRDANILLIATGTGLAPYMSMLRTELSEPGKRRFAVIHGARHSWDLGYRGELVMMEKLSGQFKYVPVVSDIDDEPTPIPWSGETGFVNSIWEKARSTDIIGFNPDPKDTHIFLCGNPLMVETMTTTLKGDGYTEHTKKEPGQIHLERFW